MNAHAPPDGAGGSANAAHLKRNCEAILLAPRAKINDACTAGWQREAARLLDEYLRTDDLRHLLALLTHLVGVRARCAK